MFGKDLNCGFTSIDETDDISFRRGMREVKVSAGDDVPFPIGMVQLVMLNEDIYKILVTVPRGMKGVMLEEVQAWSIEKSKVVSARSQAFPAPSSKIPTPASADVARTKVFICPLFPCGRMYKHMEHLKRGMLNHTMERPFQCH